MRLVIVLNREHANWVINLTVFQTEAVINAQKGISYQVELILKKEACVTHRAFNQCMWDDKNNNVHIIGTKYEDSFPDEDIGTYRGQYFLPYQE